MNNPLKTTLTATLIAAMAAPALAGGPVVIEEDEVVAQAPRSNVNPLLVLALVGVAAAIVLSGDDEDSRRTRRNTYRTRF